MKCLDCGGEYIELIANIDIEDISIGEFTVENVTHRKCSSCGGLLFPLETVKIIEAKEKEIKEYRLGQYPITDFIGAVDAAKILSVTRQALHRNRRIRRGFIYSVRFDGKIAYLKESVRLYKDTGDGRFMLANPDIVIQTEYITVNKTPSIKPALIISKTKGQPHWIKESETISEDDFILSDDYAINLNHF